MHISDQPPTQSPPTPGLTARRIEWLLFLTCFFSFAYFNQGGGWNQNSRFAEVRAIVEQGRFPIDDYLIYKRDPAAAPVWAPDWIRKAVKPDGSGVDSPLSPGGNELVRLPVKRSEYEWEGERRRLCWVSMTWEFFPVNEAKAEPGVEDAPMVEECNSGDIGYVSHTGHFHPNKPPGTSFLGVPAYWIIFQVERALGVNPDHWWPLTINAWLTSVFSVGLMSAFGCMLVFRFGRELSGGKWLPPLLAALALAFGTTYFPFATLFFDHSLTATLLFASFFCLWRVKGGGNAKVYALLAGLAAGTAALTNYIAAGAGVFLGLYALLATTPSTGGGRGVNWRAAIWFTLGVAPIFLLLCSYNVVNFGGPFKLANDFQNPLFKDPNSRAFLGMFMIPEKSEDWQRLGYIAGLLSVSPYRGVLFLSPILLMSLFGILVWLIERKYAAEARLCLGIFAFFFLVNVFFNGYHGGFSAGPRYLVPGLPFLALPLVVAFMRAKILSSILVAISIVHQGLLTVTDAQNSLAVGGHARLDDTRRKDDFFCQIVGEYAWPLFAQGRAWPVLDKLIEARLDGKREALEDEGVPEEEREKQVAELKRELVEGVERGEFSPMILGGIQGPVSVNPIGAYDGLLTFKFSPPNSIESQWNSFNAGEFLFPQSRLSLLPLLLVTGGLCGWLAVAARRRDQEEAGARAEPPPLPEPEGSGAVGEG